MRSRQSVSHVVLLLALASLVSACSAMPTAPKITCKPWAGPPAVATGTGVVTLVAHPDSTCAVR